MWTLWYDMLATQSSKWQCRRDMALSKFDADDDVKAIWLYLDRRCSKFIHKPRSEQETRCEIGKASRMSYHGKWLSWDWPLPVQGWPGYGELRSVETKVPYSRAGTTVVLIQSPNVGRYRFKFDMHIYICNCWLYSLGSHSVIPMGKGRWRYSKM